MDNPYSDLLRNPKDVEIQPLAGDASGRRYARWQHPNFGPMVYMDASNDRDGSCDDFLQVASHLADLGLSAPKILARSSDFLLLEDLGDSVFAKILENNANLEKDLYLSAVDVLLCLQKNKPVKGLNTFGTEEMARAVTPVIEWYQAGITGQENNAASEKLVSLVRSALKECEPSENVMILRDYHAENLIWLPERSGVARCGLLDFQDALLGHPAYDLASLLEDARRDVSVQTRDAAIKHFVKESGVEEEAFLHGFSVQAAQRNLRILGVLSRLAVRDGKTHYLDFLPRVWAHLTGDLEHPALTELKTFVLENIPPTTQSNLKVLGEQHA
ncbi:MULTISPECIES: aminoglycoside phosphotransferase family protein [Halocynthiibacter]|uniref:Phosphotransferase n=1 Tax=Halocynthiibacter halioticoli TaxID=2986804 RepID=A0AAE3J4A9_9RHOB|nr:MULTISPECIES: phosphotransferase [Halocynthiibacter]MCV6825632.1 phosphotransferase [Halocynthiibacter halioticoli]MCW4058633.1 phosphotransferase [Halocynthiibacter sp. SDUM655004]